MAKAIKRHDTIGFKESIFKVSIVIPKKPPNPRKGNQNISSVDSSSLREIMLAANGKKGQGKGRGFCRAEEEKSLSLPWNNAELQPHNVRLPLNSGKNHFPCD